MSPVNRIALAALAAWSEGPLRRLDVRQYQGGIELAIETDQWCESWRFANALVEDQKRNLATIVTSKVQDRIAVQRSQE